MSASLFDSTAWYRLSNDFTGPSLTLSLGLKSWPPPTPQMTPAGAYSSENWQLFFDSGVYFIRNYDYRGSLQLGITADERSLPEMLSPSGALGMQWNLSQWNGNDGTWKVTNGLLGGEGLVLGVADSGEFDGSTVLAMNADPEGAHWTFDINVSAGRITDQLSAFASLETPVPTSTSPSTSTSSLLQKQTTTPLVANTTSASIHTSSSNSTPTAQPSLSTGGATGGTTIKSASLVIAAILLIILPAI